MPTVPINVGADNRHHAYIVVGTLPDGRPDRRHREGATWEIVAQKVFELEDAMAAQDVPKPGRPMTLRQWVTHYLDVIAPVSGRHGEPLDPNTIEGYRSLFNVWVLPTHGWIELPAFQGTHLDEIYKTMRTGIPGRKHLALTSLSRAHSIIRRCLEVAMQRGLVGRNVAAMRDNPGTTKARRKRIPTIEQARRVVEVIERRPNKLRWQVGLAIGPRQGETLALRWPYVLWDDDAVDIAWQLQRRLLSHGCPDPVACARPHCRTEPCTAGPRWAHGCKDEAWCAAKPAYCPRRKATAPCFRHKNGCPRPCPAGCRKHAAQCPDRVGGLVFSRPKSAAGTELYDELEAQDDEMVHPVSLPKVLMAGLRRHQIEQGWARQRAGQAWTDWDLVFCQDDGSPLNAAADLADWKSILAEAGLAEAGTHLVRHIAATMLIDLGVPIEIVQQVLGHADIRTTRRYIQISLGLTRRAADVMGKALFGERDESDNTGGSERALNGRAQKAQRARRRTVVRV